MQDICSRELVVPLANILSYRRDQYCHLYTSNTKICQLVTILLTVVEYFLATKEALGQMILSFWEDQYGCLDTLNAKIRPLFQIL